MSRPCTGSAAEVAIAKPAETSPAVANEPVAWRIISTIASPSEAIGSRPRTLPNSGCRTSGILSICL